ncbi:hypothetical protein AAE02nite_04480 [Adhaeribacter aerolatus]|uniref:Lipoprotein n=1 Tax=Adhaeribacter aerolatus TaxID=670289 RepID=A0A512ASU3_9BACT|nr:hypothetical protein [Adhaeribacter aerolatus]GEO02784.1 hypothetical protein AAE02nite_04480 [Adhaeribacter aerolatus]
MKTTFNTLKLSTLALVLTFASTSCSLFEKKDDPKPAKNEVEYNGTKYEMDESLMVEYGAETLYGDDDTHYINDFYIANGNILYRNGTVEEVSGSFAIYTELVSNGTDKFNTGTFNYIDNGNDGSLSESQLEQKYKGKSVFGDAQIYIDTNGNRMLSDETPIHATGGTVKVSGSGNTYTLEYNLTLENGKTVRGSNSSSFSKING